MNQIGNALLIASVLTMTACATAQTTATSSALAETQTPAEPRADLLAVVIADFADASARAKAAAVAAKDPAIAKLAADRALCYDTMSARLTALSAGASANTAAKGIFSAEEKAIELNEQLQAQGGGVIPAEVRANCASYAAQKADAVVSVFNRILGIAGLRNNALLAPLINGAGAAAATMRLQ